MVIPVVAECDDSFLNDCRRMQVTADDVRAAWRAAMDSRGTTAPPPEGAVGAGTGMSCLGFKGGIGTASRVTPDGHTVAVLLLTNFGQRHELVVDGVPYGRGLPAAPGPATPAGSCIGIVVTDAATDGASCARLARRIGLGLARTGSVAHHGSGEIFLGVATGARFDRGPVARAHPRCRGPGAGPALPGHRGGGRGSRAQLHAVGHHHDRSGRQHDGGAGPPRSLAHEVTGDLVRVVR